MFLSDEEAITIQTGQTRPCSAPAAITISGSHYCNHYVYSSPSRRKTALEDSYQNNYESTGDGIGKDESPWRTAATNNTTSLHANCRSDRNPRLPRKGAATTLERLANTTTCSAGTVVVGGDSARYPFFSFSVDQRLPLFTSVAPRAVVSPSKKAAVGVVGQQQRQQQEVQHFGRGEEDDGNGAFVDTRSPQMGRGQFKKKSNVVTTTTDTTNVIDAYDHDDHNASNNEKGYYAVSITLQTGIESSTEDYEGLEREKEKAEDEERKGRTLPLPTTIGRLGQRAQGQDWELQRRSKKGRGFFGGGLVGKMLALKGAKCAREEDDGDGLNSERRKSDCVDSCNTTTPLDAGHDDNTNDNKSDDTMGIIMSLTADEIAKEQARSKVLQTILLAKRIEEDNSNTKKDHHNDPCSHHSLYSSSHHLTCPPLTSPPGSSSCCGTDNSNTTTRRATTTPTIREVTTGNCITGQTNCRHHGTTTTDEKSDSRLERRITAGRRGSSNNSSGSGSSTNSSITDDGINGHHHHTKNKPIKSGLLFSLTRKYDNSFTTSGAANTNINKNNNITASDSIVARTNAAGPNTTADRRESTQVAQVEALQRAGRRYLSVSQHVRLVSILHIIDCCLALSHGSDATNATVAPEEVRRIMLRRGSGSRASSNHYNTHSTRTLIRIAQEYEDALHIDNLANAYALEEEQRYCGTRNGTSSTAGANDDSSDMDDTDEEIHVHVLDDNECRRKNIKTAFRYDGGGEGGGLGEGKEKAEAESEEDGLDGLEGHFLPRHHHRHRVRVRPLRHCVLHTNVVLKLIADELLSSSNNSTSISRTSKDGENPQCTIDFRVENSHAGPSYAEKKGEEEDHSSSAESSLVDYLSLGVDSYRNEAVRLYKLYIHYRMAHNVTMEHSITESSAASAAAVSGSHYLSSQGIFPTGPTEGSLLLSFLQGLKEEICPLGAKRYNSGFPAGGVGLLSGVWPKETRSSYGVPPSSSSQPTPTMITTGTNTDTNNNNKFQSTSRANNNNNNTFNNNNNIVGSSMNIFEERRLRKRLTRCEDDDSDEEGDIRALQRELGIRIDEEGGEEDEDEGSDTDGEDDKRSGGKFAPRSQALRGDDHTDGDVDGNSARGASNNHHGATKASGGGGGGRGVVPSFPSSSVKTISSLSSSSLRQEVSTVSTDYHPNSSDTTCTNNTNSTSNNNNENKMMRLPFQRNRKGHHQKAAQSSLTSLRRAEKRTDGMVIIPSRTKDPIDYTVRNNDRESLVFGPDDYAVVPDHDDQQQEEGFPNGYSSGVSDTSRVGFSAARTATSSSFLFSSPSSSSCGRECAICELDGFNVIECECCGRWFHADCGVLAMRIFSSGSDEDEDAEKKEKATRADERGAPCRSSCETRHTLCSRWCADNYLESKLKRKIKK